MIINVEIACKKPEKLKLHAVVAELPYGKVNAAAVAGGLDIQNAYMSDGHPTIIVHAAINIALNLCKIEHKK